MITNESVRWLKMGGKLQICGGSIHQVSHVGKVGLKPRSPEMNQKQESKKIDGVLKPQRVHGCGGGSGAIIIIKHPNTRLQLRNLLQNNEVGGAGDGAPCSRKAEHAEQTANQSVSPWTCDTAVSVKQSATMSSYSGPPERVGERRPGQVIDLLHRPMDV